MVDISTCGNDEKTVASQSASPQLERHGGDGRSLPGSCQSRPTRLRPGRRRGSASAGRACAAVMLLARALAREIGRLVRRQPQPIWPPSRSREALVAELALLAAQAHRQGVPQPTPRVAPARIHALRTSGCGARWMGAIGARRSPTGAAGRHQRRDRRLGGASRWARRCRRMGGGFRPDRPGGGARGMIRTGIIGSGGPARFGGKRRRMLASTARWPHGPQRSLGWCVAVGRPLAIRLPRPAGRSGEAARRFRGGIDSQRRPGKVPGGGAPARRTTCRCHRCRPRVDASASSTM